MSSRLKISKPFRFLDLPKELRDIIYEYLMPRASTFSIESILTFGVRPSYTTSDATNLQWPISQVCYQIRQEALFAYYSSTPFTFDFLWHKDIESARRWLTCQHELAISSMKDITFRHGSLDLEHHALIQIDVRKSLVSIRDEAFEACIEGKTLQLVVQRLQEIVDGLDDVDGKPMLTRNAFGEMLDAMTMMFGMQRPAGIPITLCHSPTD